MNRKLLSAVLLLVLSLETNIASAQFLQPPNSGSALSELKKRTNIGNDIIKQFEQGAPRAKGIVLLRGRLSRSFYRPVLDDSPADQQSAYADLAQRYSSPSSGVFLSPQNNDGTTYAEFTVQGALALSADERVFTVSTIPKFVMPSSPSSDETPVPLQTSLQSSGFLQLPGSLNGSTVKIAVHDSGFDPNAPNALGIFDPMVCAINDPFCSPVAGIQFHGHKVATTIRRSAQGLGSSWGVGAAQGAVIVPVNYNYTLTGAQETLGLLENRPDIKVINMSWSTGSLFSGSGNCDNNPNFNAVLASLNRLKVLGKVLVAGTGNSYNSDGIGSPACLSPVIAVGGHFSCTSGVNCDFPFAREDQIYNGFINGLASGSDMSDAVDLVAPGGPIQLLMPDEVEYGTGSPGRNGAGTSYASPIAAACVARMMQANPTATPAAIESALKASPNRAHRAGNPARTWPKLNCADAVARIQAVSTSIPLSNPNLSGTYYNPATDGQGFIFNVAKLSHDAFVLAAGWYTYDDAVPTGSLNQQSWYSLDGGFSAGARDVTVNIRKNVGGVFASGITPSAIVGRAVISFQDCNHLSVRYHFDSGSIGTIALQRLTPAPPNCESGLVPADPLWQLGNFWYNPSMDGQGIVIETNPAQNVAVGGWYTYAAPNAVGADSDRQRWYTLVPKSGGLGNGQVVNFDVVQSTGGRFNTATSIAPVTGTDIGDATLTHTNCTQAQLNYNIRPTDTSAPLAGLINLTALIPRAACGL